MAGKGQAGSGGNRECAELLAEAENALQKAQVCNLDAGAMQCVGFVDDLCGCPVPVNNPNNEDGQRYLAALKAAEKCLIACPAILCGAPTDALCVGTGGSTMGRCVVAISTF